MEDKEVKDKTVPDNKAPEKQKDLKKPSGKSATGKPLDGIDINPQLNDVSTDGNQLKIRKEDSVDLAAPVIQEKAALSLAQRQKRARVMRSHERSIERAREVAKKKLAGPTQIELRAMHAARNIVKKRFSARKGVPYAELTTTEKIQVDTAVSKKTKLIKKIAARLLPRIRKAEYERLKSFRNGEKLKDLSTQNPKSQGIMPKVTEEMAQLFDTLNTQDATSLIGIIENTIEQFKTANDPMGEQLKKMLTAVLPEDVVTESLLKKSDKTGIAFSTLREVFERGEYDWDSSNRMTREQYAFARVNSYIGKGKAWHMDADLREEKAVNEKLDEAFTTFMEAKMKGEDPCWKGYQMVGKKKKGGKEVPNCVPEETQATKARKKIELVDRPPADQGVKSRQAEIQKKIIDEARAPGRAYVKPHIEKGSTKQTGWKASDKWGKVKYFRNEFKSSAEKHAFKEDTSADREIGTDKLVKKYKKDTPGQSLDESFNMAWTSGIGVTLSAADCGIQIKGGFALHPGVIDQMEDIEEDVVAADKKPVYMPPRRHADGSYGKATTIMRKAGKKIIDVKEPEDVDSDEHDGK